MKRLWKLLPWIVLGVPSFIGVGALVVDGVIHEYYVMPRALAEFRARAKDIIYLDGKVPVPRSNPSTVFEVVDILGNECKNAPWVGCYNKDKYPAHAKVYYRSKDVTFQIVAPCTGDPDCVHNEKYDVYSKPVPPDQEKKIGDEAGSTYGETRACTDDVIWHYSITICNGETSEYGAPESSYSGMTTSFPWYEAYLGIDMDAKGEVGIQVNYIYGSVNVDGPSADWLRETLNDKSQ